MSEVGDETNYDFDIIGIEDPITANNVTLTYSKVEEIRQAVTPFITLVLVKL